jgi:hypothetical protein
MKKTGRGRTWKGTFKGRGRTGKDVEPGTNH